MEKNQSTVPFFLPRQKAFKKTKIVSIITDNQSNFNCFLYKKLEFFHFLFLIFSYSLYKFFRTSLSCFPAGRPL